MCLLAWPGLVMPEAVWCAVLQSYCPYTRLPSGVALATGSGAVYGGRYVESAAYNPSLPPLQSALAAAVIGGLPDYKQVSASCARHGRVRACEPAVQVTAGMLGPAALGYLGPARLHGMTYGCMGLAVMGCVMHCMYTVCWLLGTLPILNPQVLLCAGAGGGAGGAQPQRGAAAGHHQDHGAAPVP